MDGYRQKKHKPVEITSQSWLDKLIRLKKNGVTMEKTIKEQLQNRIEDSDDNNSYGMEEQEGNNSDF